MAKIKSRGYVRMKLPRVEGKNALQQEFFSVNGKNYMIKRGEYVDVPPEISEVIENGDKALDAAFEFSEKVKFKDTENII